jgi:hypothetical protein
MFKMIASSDHISAKTTASPVILLSKAGGAFATAGGTITEVSNGWYKIALTTTDTNTTGDLAYYITGSSADDTDFVDQVGDNYVTSNIKKNQQLLKFTFTMTDSTTHAPKTGLTGGTAPVVQASKDGGAFSTIAGSPATEISNGDYYVDLAAGDLNANVVMLRMTATGADDLNILIITQP